MTTFELDTKIENIISRTVKYYYSDWKNYDRPKYMKLKGLKPEGITLIVRKCGTYIFDDLEIEQRESAAAILEYYTSQEEANVYKINLHKNTIKLVHKGITR